MYDFELIVNIDDFFLKLGEVMNGHADNNNDIMNAVSLTVNEIEGSTLKNLVCSTNNEEYMELWKEAFRQHDANAVITYPTKEEKLIADLQEENKLLGRMLTDMELSFLELQIRVESKEDGEIMATTKTSTMYERLLERYLKGYITDSQLERYVTLKQITAEEAAEMIRMEKYLQENPEHRPELLPEE